jgi:hypothetical protein
MFTWQYAIYDAWKRGKGPLAFIFGYGYMYILWMKSKKKLKLKLNEYKRNQELKKKEKEKDKLAEKKRKKLEKKKKGKKTNEEEEGNGSSSSSSEEEEEDEDQEKKDKEKEEKKEENPENDEMTSLLSNKEEKEENWEDEDPESNENISDSSEIFDALHGLLKADHVLDIEYEAEMRMVIHFQLLTIVSAKSRVEKESVEFQMFLRENRFKLMANGVRPPQSIFRSNSYANIDMKLVANWLIRLTNEQHERFNQLRDRFSTEMEEREHIQDMEDAQLRLDEEAYLEMREQEDWRQGQIYLQDVQRRKKKREENDIELPVGVSLDIAIAREKLEEIANGKSGKLKPGKFGRDQQWIDSEFPMVSKSVGRCAALPLIKSWKEARAINVDCDLFKGGTDPDDVHQGKK